MSNATYILGTDEYVVWEIECTTPGFVYDPAEWTAKAAMVAIGTAFVDEPTSFVDAALTAVDGKNYGKAKLVDLGGTVLATSRILTRLTKTTGGTQTPLLKAGGRVIVEAG